MKLSNILTLSTVSTGILASHRHIKNIYAREDSNISRSISSEGAHSRRVLVPSYLKGTNTSRTSTSSSILRAGSPVAHTASCTTKNQPLSTSELVLLEVLFDERVPETQTTYADWLIAYLSKLTSDIYAISNDAINLGGLSFTSSLESVDASGILKLASDAPLYTCYLSSIFEDAISTPYTIPNGLTPEENGKLVALFEKRGDTSNYGYNLADDIDTLVSRMHKVAEVVATATDLSYTSYFSLLDFQELFSIASDAPIYTNGLSSAFSSALSEYSSQTTIKVTTTKNLTVTHSLLGYHVSVSIPSTSVPQKTNTVSSADELTSYIYNTSTLDETTTVTSCSLESDASKIELLHQVHTETTIVTVTVCDRECENLHSLATAAISTVTITGTTTIVENGSTTESAITKTTTTCDEECQSKASAAMSAISTIVSTVTSTVTGAQSAAVAAHTGRNTDIYTVNGGNAHTTVTSPTSTAVRLVHKLLTDTSIFTVTVCDRECENLHSLATAAISTVTITGTTTIVENGSTTESAITETVTTCDEECQSKASAASYAVSTIVSTFVTTITEVESSTVTSQSAVAVPVNAHRAVNTETVTDIETLVNTETIVTTVTICEGDCESLRSAASEAVRTITVTDVTTIVERGSTVESTITETVTTCDEECQSKASAASYAVSTIVSTFVTTITEVESSTVTSQSAVAVPVNAHRAVNTETVTDIETLVNTETIVTTVTICEGDCESLRSAASEAIKTVTITDVTTIVEHGSTTESTITETVTTCDEECQSKASAASYAVSTIVSTFVTTITEVESSTVTSQSAVAVPVNVHRAVNTETVTDIETLVNTETIVTTVTICEGDCESLRSAASEAVRTITVTDVTTIIEKGSTVESTITETVTTCDEECQSKASAASYAVSTIVSTFVTTITEVESSTVTSQSAVAVPVNVHRAVNTETVTDIETLVNTETIVTTVTICEGDCESLRSAASEAVRTITVTDVTTIIEKGSTVESTITETVTTCDEECQSKASAASYAVSTIVSTFVTAITKIENSVVTSKSAVTVPVNAHRAVNTETLATTITICEGDCESLRSAASEAVRTVTITDVTTIVEHGSTTESAITKTTTICDEECQSKASAASYAVSTIVSTFVTAETLRDSSTMAAAAKNGATSGVATSATSEAANSVSYLRATMKDPVVTVSICDEKCMSIRRAAASAINTVTLASTIESVANGSTMKSVTTELQTTCDVECESKVSEAEHAVRTSLSTIKRAADATTLADIATDATRKEEAGPTLAAAHVTTTVAPVRGATVAATDVNATKNGATTTERADDKKDGQRATIAAQATPAAYTHSTSYVATPRAENTISVSAQEMNGAAKGSVSNTWVVLMAGLVLLI